MSGTNYPSSPSLFPLSYNESPITHLFREMTRPMSWLHKVRCSNHLQSDVMSLTPLVSLFSSCGLETYCSHQNSSTRRSAQYPRYSLQFLVTLLVFDFDAMDTAFCETLISFQIWHISESLTQRLRSSDPRHHSSYHIARRHSFSLRSLFTSEESLFLLYKAFPWPLATSS